MNTVAGNANQPLYQDEVIPLCISNRLVEDHDVAAPGLAVVNQRHPFGGRGKGDAVHHQVIAHQQRLLHGAGGNDEVLAEEGEDKKANNQNGADAGHRLVGRLFHALFKGLGLRRRRGSRRFFLGHSFARCLQCTTRKMRFQRANPVSLAVSSLSCPSLSSEASSAAAPWRTTSSPSRMSLWLCFHQTGSTSGSV